MSKVHTFKILVVGDAGVGKSSLLLRFTDDVFNPNLGPTVGVDFKVKICTFNGVSFKLAIWDTAGQERFMALNPAFYRGAQGVLLVYDVTNARSFRKLNHWLEEINRYATHREIVKILVGNKMDMEIDRQVLKSDGESFASTHGMLFLETTATNQACVQLAFEQLIFTIVQKPGLFKQNSTAIVPKKKEKNGFQNCNHC